MPINALCGCGCGKLTRKRDANGQSMCSAARKLRTKAPIKVEVTQNAFNAKFMSHIVPQSTEEGMDSMLCSLGVPRTRHKKKASGEAQVRRRLMNLIHENAYLKMEVARQKKEISCGAEDVARLRGQLGVTAERVALMLDTQDWIACARRANCQESLPPTVARRVTEVCRGSRAAPQV